MIYPSRRAILAAGGLALPALLVGVFAPAWWTAGLAALGALILLIVLDAALGAGKNHADLYFEGPPTAGVGAEFELDVGVHFLRAPPPTCEVAIDRHYLLEPLDGLERTIRIGKDGRGSAHIKLRSIRRGEARLEHVWLRWRGQLGLVWKQKQLRLDEAVLIVPDIAAVRARSAQLLHRDMMQGLAAQMQLGEGAEFEALAEFQQGMDRRAIDWKQSARHTQLLAKEYRTERNNNIIVALDSGRTMCEPLAGLPKIDRAVSAALLTAFVALKDGDRVSLFSFDSHPRVSTKPASGQRSFALLQRVAAGIEYSDRETNYTLALATLATGLHRRSLIVFFTDFSDTIAAEMMLSAVAALLQRHLVLFILFRDEELDAFTAAAPASADDVTKAVTAAALIRERRLVVTRLRRLGVHVIETRHEEAGPALVSAYVDMKRRNLL
ncbi:MAG TPA: DUF58 domain-containing protein [Allosphingosinicella sp.]